MTHTEAVELPVYPGWDKRPDPVPAEIHPLETEAINESQIEEVKWRMLRWNLTCDSLPPQHSWMESELNISLLQAPAATKRPGHKSTGINLYPLIL